MLCVRSLISWSRNFVRHGTVCFQNIRRAGGKGTRWFPYKGWCNSWVTVHVVDSITALFKIPTDCNLSMDCRNLLMRLLERDQNKRISFEEFFNHPFIDLEHIPGPSCLGKAVSLLTLTKSSIFCTRNRVYIPKNVACLREFSAQN